MKEKLFNNVLINIIAVLWRIIIGFVVMPIMVNHLGNEKYGVWTLAVSFTIFGYLNIAELGIGTAVIKYVSEYLALNKRIEANLIISSSFLYFLGIGVIIAIAFSLFIRFGFFHFFNVPNELIRPTSILLYLMAVKAVLDFPSQSVSSTLEGLQRYDIWRAIEIIRETLRAAAIITALYLGKGIIILGLILVGESVFNLIVYSIAVKWQFPEWKMILRIPKEIINKVVRFSSKIFIIRINAIIYNGMDKIIIGSFLVTGLLTPYSIASAVHTIANRMVSLVSLPLLPTSSMLSALQDNDSLKKILLQGTKYSIAISLPVTLGLIVLSKYLILYWMGPNHLSVTPLAQLFLSYLIIGSLAPVAYNMLIGMDKTKQLLIIQISSTIINLFISIALIKRLGVAGVITGTIVGTSIAVVPYLLILFKEIHLSWKVFYRDTILKVYPLAFLSTFLIFLAVKSRPPQSLLEVGIYMVINILLFILPFVFIGLDKGERSFFVKRITSLLKKMSLKK